MGDTDERAIMVHALREEPGSYVRALGDRSEVIYAVCPSVGGFVAEWEYVPGAGEAARSQREDFSSYADALVQRRPDNLS